MATQIIDDEPIEVYHARPYASSSKLKDFLARGHAYYKREYLRPPEAPSPVRESTDAQTFGQAFEDAVLFRDDMDKWHDRYTVRPPGLDLRTNKGKEWKATVPAHATILTHAEGYAIERMVHNTFANKTARAMIENAVPQRTLREVNLSGAWEHVPGLQGRPDYLGDGVVQTSGLAYSLDLKAMSDFQMFVGGQHIEKFAYDMQAAIVKELLPHVEPYCLLAEKVSPWRVVVVEFPDELLAHGAMLLDRGMSLLSVAHRDGDWPLHPCEMVTAGVPGRVRARLPE